MEELEEVFPDEEELLVKKRLYRSVPYPALSVYETHNIPMIYFNRLAQPYIPDYIEWRTTSQYIIGLPSDRNNINAFRAWKGERHTYVRASDALIREKKVRPGTYKIYKYRNGFCFKRYEPIE